MSKDSHKHKRSRIGLAKGLKFTTKSNNTFRVYGDSVGTPPPAPAPQPVKVVLVTGKHHDWGPATFTNVDTNTLEITAYCPQRHSNPDDDLTVTIILDPNTPIEDLTTITFPDVEYDG